MALLAVEDLTFAYPGAERPALEGVSLEVPEGGWLCLGGRSGCGKTTLLRQLKSALRPHGERSGAVRFAGRPLDEVPAREQAAAIGFVLQDPEAQVVTGTVRSELAFGPESLGWDQPAIALCVAEAASFFGLEGWLDRDVASLSGGQLQRLNLAAALALGPRVLVLDEPTAQLDPVAAAEFLEAVRRANQELGVAVVMAEQRLGDAFALADSALVLEEGRVCAYGAPREVGAALWARGDALALGLPAPLRIWLAVEGATAAPGGGASGEELAEGAGPEGEEALGDGPEVLGCPAQGRCRAADGACAWPMGPSPAAEAQGAARSAAPPAGSRPAPSVPAALDRCPLTVREGRSWLRGYAKRHGLVGRALPEAPVSSAAAAAELALELRNVWARYGRQEPDVLRGMHLQARRGEVLALVGGNGAGKTTMLRALCGTVRPHRGTVRVLGRSPQAWGAALFRGGVALLPQDPTALFAQDAVGDELQEMLAGRGLSAEERQDRLAQVVGQCDVGPLLAAHPWDLSGGERQRAALAKVLLADPQVLLLDEPTKGLDAGFKERLAALLRELAAQGVAVVMVSHDLDFCARCATEAALLSDGAIAAAGPPRQLFSRARLYTTAASRMSRSVLAGAVTDEDVVALCLR